MSHHYSGPDFGFPNGDARLDLTDLYAFPKPGEAGKSILIMNVHPSAVVNPLGPLPAGMLSPEALTKRALAPRTAMSIANIAYQCASCLRGPRLKTATLRYVEGAQAAGTSDSGQIIVEAAAVSTGRRRTRDAGRRLPLLRRQGLAERASRTRVMSAIGTKQTSIPTANMSAFGGKADISDQLADVR